MPSRQDSPAEPGPALRALRERALRRNLPLHALWEVTYSCPLRCRHCYLARDGEQEELTSAEAKELLVQMARLGVMFLALTGGEPLLRDDLFKIIDKARALGFTWRLLTTGTLLDARAERDLADRGPLGVEMSLHGLEQAHDSVTRVPGSFHSAVRAIERLVGLGVRVVVKMSLTPSGLNDLPALRQLCARLGARLNVSTIMLPDVEGSPVKMALRLSDEELAEYSVESESVSPCEFGRHRLPGKGEPLCGAGRSSFCISPCGDVRACAALRASHGNVRDRALREIWKSDSMAEFRRLTAGDRVQCRDCPDAEFCFFCPGQAERETGDPLGAPPSACREARVRRMLAEVKGRRPKS